MTDVGTSTTVATAPPPRTVTARGEGVWEGWEVTARADFPARILFDLQSSNQPLFYAALDRIVIAHNFPDADGRLAETMADVMPREGVQHMAGQIFDAIAALPKL